MAEQKEKIEVEYDYELYQVLKHALESDFEGGTWIAPKNDVAKFNDYLNRVEYNFSALCNKFSKFKNQTLDDFVKTVKIKVKDNPKSLTLDFNYDENIVKYIKYLEKKRYNSVNKTWNIRKRDVSWLYAKLADCHYIDKSELDPYVIDEVEPLKVDLNQFHMDRTPKDYQVDCANMLLKNRKIINTLKAGLGKTFITVLATETIKEKTLIACPVSAKGVWEEEIKIVNEDADINVISGGDEYQTADYVIINYDIMDRYYDDIINDDFKVLVCDEAHKIRGVTDRGVPSSKRAKVMVGTEQVRGIADSMDYVFPITATPFINYTKDIFNLLKVIDHPMTDNWYSFANSYCGGEDNGYGRNYKGSSNQEQLNERLYPEGIMRIDGNKYIDLPSRTRTFIPLDINLKEYNREVEEYLKDAGGGQKDYGSALVKMGAMRMKLAQAKARQSYKVIDDLLEQNKSVVIMTNYESVVQILAKKYGDKAVRVTGSESHAQRTKNVKQFQLGGVPILIGNIDAAGEAITLTKAHHMIVVDMHYSPIIMLEQMEKRIHRISQEQPVNIYYLYSPKAEIDKIMVDMLNRKLNDSSKALDGKSVDFFQEELIKEFEKIVS